MFEVRVETTFEAAHQVGPDGAPLPLHHHSWQVAVRARAEELNSMGLVVDFRQLRAAADEAVALLDQRVIEDVPDFADRPSTPAAVAEWLFEKLARAVPSPRCWLEAVEVEADPGIRFEYSGTRAATGI